MIKKGKGYIKEFNNYGDLIFEGEYLNGEKNGKGKIFENDLLRFECNYLKGKRHGKAKEYEKGKLIFECD